MSRCAPRLNRSAPPPSGASTVHSIPASISPAVSRIRADKSPIVFCPGPISQTMSCIESAVCSATLRMSSSSICIASASGAAPIANSLSNPILLRLLPISSCRSRAIPARNCCVRRRSRTSPLHHPATPATTSIPAIPDPSHPNFQSASSLNSHGRRSSGPASLRISYFRAIAASQSAYVPIPSGGATPSTRNAGAHRSIFPSICPDAVTTPPNATFRPPAFTSISASANTPPPASDLPGPTHSFSAVTLTYRPLTPPAPSTTRRSPGFA